MVNSGMTRKRPPKLVDPQNAHNAVTLQLLGVPTGKDRSIADQRARLAEPGSDRPKVVTGNIDDGTVFNDLLNVLQQRNIIVNKAERGGQFGVEHRNAMLVNADSPLFLFNSQGTSDTASTTNTGSTVVAFSTGITLGVGKWAIIAIASIILGHSTGGTVGVSAEIEGDEGTIRLVSTVPSTGQRCEAHIARTDEADWLDGEQLLNIRARFRSNTAGTTSAKNPTIYCIAKRMD
jgi:hypothetical protein